MRGMSRDAGHRGVAARARLIPLLPRVAADLAALAALGVVLAGILVYVAGRGWDRMHGHPLRDRFARAIKPVVLGLVWAGVVTLARGATTGPVTIAMALVATVVLLRTDWNQSLLVLAAGVIGAVALR